jgi:hypothetical protein
MVVILSSTQMEERKVTVFAERMVVNGDGARTSCPPERAARTFSKKTFFAEI